jgi:hypothetical protein
MQRYLLRRISMYYVLVFVALKGRDISAQAEGLVYCRDGNEAL